MKTRRRCVVENPAADSAPPHFEPLEPRLLMSITIGTDPGDIGGGIIYWPAPSTAVAFDARNPYTASDADATVTVYLRGSGTGSVDRGEITLTGTTAQSSLIIRLRGAAQSRFSFEELTIHGDIGSIVAPRVDFERIAVGSVLNISAGRLTESLTIGGDITKRPAAVALDTVSDATITSATPLRVFSVARWIDSEDAGEEPGQLTAPWIGTLVARGERFYSGSFGANITLNQADARGYSLSNARLAAPIGYGSTIPARQWRLSGNLGTLHATSATNIDIDVLGSVGAIRFNSAAGALSIDAQGSIGSISMTDWSTGSLEADALGVLRIRGDRRNYHDGDFGATMTLGGVDGVTTTLGSAIIAGDWTGQTQITGGVNLFRAASIPGQVTITGSVGRLFTGDYVTIAPVQSGIGGFIDVGGSSIVRSASETMRSTVGTRFYTAGDHQTYYPEDLDPPVLGRTVTYTIETVARGRRTSEEVTVAIDEELVTFDGYSAIHARQSSTEMTGDHHFVVERFYRTQHSSWETATGSEQRLIRWYRANWGITTRWHITSSGSLLNHEVTEAIDETYDLQYSGHGGTTNKWMLRGHEMIDTPLGPRLAIKVAVSRRMDSHVTAAQFVMDGVEVGPAPVAGLNFIEQGTEWYVPGLGLVRSDLVRNTTTRFTEHQKSERERQIIRHRLESVADA